MVDFYQINQSPAINVSVYIIHVTVHMYCIMEQISAKYPLFLFICVDKHITCQKLTNTTKQHGIHDDDTCSAYLYETLLAS